MKISRFFHVWIPGRCWGPQNISGETFEYFSHFLPKKLKFGYLWGTTDTSVYSWDPNDMPKRPKIAKKTSKNRRNFASFSCVYSRKVLWVSKYFWRNFSIFLTFSPQKIQILVPLGYHRHLCLLLRSKPCAQNSQKQIYFWSCSKIIFRNIENYFLSDKKYFFKM